MIDRTFEEMEADEAMERYEKFKKLFDTARKLWAAAEPKLACFADCNETPEN